MKKSFRYLKKNIKPSMTLPEMVDAFEKMSAMPIDTDDDTLLMDPCFCDPTFSGRIVHLFSLARQIPNKKGEYFQIRLDITLEIDKNEFAFPKPIWSDSIDGDFFDAVKKSAPYLQAVNEKIIKAEVHLDKT